MLVVSVLAVTDWLQTAILKNHLILAKVRANRAKKKGKSFYVAVKYALNKILVLIVSMIIYKMILLAKLILIPLKILLAIIHLIINFSNFN